MITMRALAFLLAAAIPSACAADSQASAALAKAVAAFESNLAKQKHWNWTITETRGLLDKSGKSVVAFPPVTSESVIRSNGRRCNAVTAWGDGREPYMKDADADERCQAYDALGTPFDVAILLKSANARLQPRTGSTIAIAVLPDKTKLHAPEYAIRCAASIKATIELDPAGYFPVSIEGEVAESGCDSTFVPVVHYETASRQPMVGQFRKGAAFLVKYALQKDRFENPENSYWISVTQHYLQPWNSEAKLLYYWGRQFRVFPNHATHLVKDVKTTAQEFGVGSQLRFDKEP
jgi:hypothetical protein